MSMLTTLLAPGRGNASSGAGLLSGRDILYYPEHLDRWRTKLADARYDQATIVVAGNSVVQGAYANNAASSDHATWRERGWVGQLRSLFADRYGEVGEGVVFSGDTSRVALSGGATRVNSSGIGVFRNPTLLAAQAHVATFTMPASTTVRIYAWWVNAAFEYNIDGAGWVAGSTTSGDTLYYDEITGLADTAHTVQVRGVDTKTHYIVGVGAFRDTDSGVAVHRFGKDATVLKDATSLFDGVGTSPERQARSMFTMYGTDLVVLAFSVSNVTGGYSTHGLDPTEVAAGTTLVVDYLTSLNVDVLLVGGPWRDPATAASPDSQQVYDDAVKAVASTRDGVAFLDLKELWDSYAEGNTLGLYQDTVHPTRLGHSTIAKAVFEALGGV